MGKNIAATLIILSCSILFVKTAICQTDSVSEKNLPYLTVRFQQFGDRDLGFVGGTGTIIKHSDKYFLVTAAHVAKSLEKNAYVQFPHAKAKNTSVHLISLTGKNGLKWIKHPLADVALLELIAPNPELAQQLSKWCFPSELIYKGREPVAMETAITFFSYDYFQNPYLPPNNFAEILKRNIPIEAQPRYKADKRSAKKVYKQLS